MMGSPYSYTSSIGLPTGSTFLLFRSLTSFYFYNIECGDRYCPPKVLLAPYRLFDLRVMRILCRIACFGDRGTNVRQTVAFVFFLSVQVLVTL